MKDNIEYGPLDPEDFDNMRNALLRVSNKIKSLSSMELANVIPWIGGGVAIYNPDILDVKVPMHIERIVTKDWAVVSWVFCQIRDICNPLICRYPNRDSYYQSLAECFNKDFEKTSNLEASLMWMLQRAAYTPDEMQLYLDTIRKD